MATQRGNPGPLQVPHSRPPKIMGECVRYYPAAPTLIMAEGARFENPDGGNGGVRILHLRVGMDQEAEMTIIGMELMRWALS
jgi:hypothetical protein